MNTAVLVRHQAKPGQRNAVQKVWERHVRPHAEANPEHIGYFYCFERDAPDMICAFQVYARPEAAAEFIAGAWYQQYLAELAPLVAAPPQISQYDVQWAKAGG